jgi:hypothetical protein
MGAYDIPGPRDCPSCGVVPGQVHVENCDWARCRFSGEQYIQCFCNDCKPDKYTGWYPGTLECFEYDLFTDPNSHWGFGPDLNTLVISSSWSIEDQRYYLIK